MALPSLSWNNAKFYMQELFYEECAQVQNAHSAKRKYNIFKTISIFFYILTGIWVVAFIYLYIIDINNPLFDFIIFLIPTAILLASAIFAGIFKNRFYLDYDYTFVSGSIRVAKVIKNIKRKFLISFETSCIEKIGPYGSKAFFTYNDISGINKQIFTQNEFPAENKDFYYIVANVNSQKQLMVFECTELFIRNVLKYSKKTVIDEELVGKKWFILITPQQQSLQNRH